ncbi:MAG TPA: protein kinase [Polyangiales bacterium]|nr:protein kinase [Polyangiales bacterium]
MTAQPIATHTDLTGRVLLGRYRIVRELAKGGMGVVYLARVEGAVGFVKPVVVKLLLPEHTEDPRIVGMFVREARILSQLRHPSLVDVLEFGEQDGGYVLVLEYVRGYHLGLWLRYLQEKKRIAPANVLLQIVIDVLDALHHAHTQVHPDGTSMQIVHRDVSPSNILLDEAGRGRLLDFGVARMRGGGHEYKTQVQGGFMGKLPYTAPEIFSGGEASPRSDLYACAVVLHEALFGRNVFRGETQASTLQRVLNHPPEALEAINLDIPRGLDQVLARALAKSPVARHADAHEFAMDLRRLLHAPESEVRARLAEVLKQDFGPEMSKLFNLESLAERDAAWRRLSDSKEKLAAAAQSPANDTGPLLGKAPSPAGATIVSRNKRGNTAGDQVAQPSGPQQALSGPPTIPAGPRPNAAPAADTSQAGAPQPTAAKPKRTMLIAAGGGALAAIALALAAMFWLRSPSTQPPEAPLGAAGTPTVFHPANPLPPLPNTATPTPTVEPVQQPIAATPDPPENRKPKATPDASALTRALRKQRPRLEACFIKHSVSLQGHATTQLMFDLATDGTLTHVEVSPSLLAQTELGQCLLNVARSTRFPPQPRAVSFSIPLTASSGH